MKPPFRTLEAAKRYDRLEGFIVGVSTCRYCGYVMHGSHPPETDNTKLECFKCGARDSKFIEDAV